MNTDMSSNYPAEIGKVFIPFGFTIQMRELIDVMSRSLNPRSKYKPIRTTLTTIDRDRVTVDLNTCRPISSSRANTKMPKEKLQQQEDLEDLIIVWLDEHLHQTENQFNRRINDLRQIINCLMAFDNVEQCLQYITSIEQEKILLIVSGSLAKTMIEDINKFDQVLFTYIFCWSPNSYRALNEKCHKIRGIFIDDYELITQITNDVSAFFQNILPINVINSIDINERSFQDVTKDQARFMWSRLLMKALVELPQTNHSKQELIDESRRHYKNNNSQQDLIVEFEETYSSSDAISWYTRAGFLYSLVNKALRTQNIVRIFKCRFFIIDIFEELTKLYSKFIETLGTKTFTVYRGQLMTAQEFSKLQNSIDGFVSFNTFVSTSISSAVVLPFTGYGGRRPLYESVFFEIEIDLDGNTVPFAKISQHSRFESEDEVLICMGAVFRIESIETLTEDIWHVKLISVDHEKYAKLDDLESYLKAETNMTLKSLSLGKILQMMGQYDQAQALYDIVLSALPANHTDRSAVYNDLGMAVFKLDKNPRVVLNYLLQSLTLQMNVFPKYFLMFTQTLINICSVYSAMRNTSRALSLLRLTLKILEFDRSNNASRMISLQKSEIYNNIGVIYLKRGRLSQAVKYLKMSLRIQRKDLPDDHPDVGLTLNNIGMAYIKLCNSEKAYQYFDEGMKIVEKSLPFENHESTARLYNNMGLFEYNRNNFDKALMFYEKARIIQLKCLPPTHRKTAVLCSNIGLVYFEQEQYDSALNMFKECLRILQQCVSADHREICYAHINIAKTYRALNDHFDALDHCTKAIDLGKRCLSSSHLYIVQAHQTLGNIYYDLEHYSAALEEFNTALKIYLKNRSMNKIYLGMLYKSISMVYRQRKDFINASKSINKAIVIFERNDVKQYEECVNTAQELTHLIVSFH